MQQKLTTKQAKKLKEVIESKTIAEREYANALKRENEILELILDAYSIDEAESVRLDNEILHIEKKAKKK